MLFRLAKMPPAYNASLAVSFYNTCLFAGVIHCGFSIWMFGYWLLPGHGDVSAKSCLLYTSPSPRDS